MKATTASRRCLLLSSLVFTITAAAFLPLHNPTSMRIHHHHHHERQLHQTPVLMTVLNLFQQQKDEEEKQQKQQKQEYRPISDYVGGLHDGKYVFDDRISGITALNYETSILVFDYPNDDDDEFIRQRIAPPPEGGNKPNWASRKLGPDAFDDAPQLQILDLDKQGKTENVVQVVNEELSWEPFWASVETLMAAINIRLYLKCLPTVEPWHLEVNPMAFLIAVVLSYKNT